jgi:hypothetical protein
MAHGLSKSRYTAYRACDKALWLNVFKPEEAVIDPQTEGRFAVGTEVGELAQGLLGPYEVMTVWKEDGHLDYKAMIAKTQDAIERGVQNICEAAFSYDGNYCAVDILHKVRGGYSIYEVKSSTHPDNEIYAWDVAFQKYVLTGCGIRVKGSNLVCINTDYVRHGDIDIQELFSVNDISDAVDAELPNIEANIEDAKMVLEGGEPTDDLSPACDNPYPCAFWEYCTKKLPKPSVFNLYWMNKKKKFELYKSGIVGYEDLGDIKLTRIQKMQVAGALNGEVFIDKAGIQSFLDTLSYPLYYLDFETIQPAVPLYDGTHPYQQITTQYSLHVQEEEGGELRHLEFLAPTREDPMRPIAESLCRDIPADACVLAYNKGFECGRIAELAEMFPDLADHLLAIRDNVRDLLVPFQAGCYYLPSMGGSFSIKSVLPALFPNDPELDYHALDELCQNGTMAMNLYPMLKDMNADDEARARRALLDYCCLDTLAMVKVLSKLYEAVK